MNDVISLVINVVLDQNSRKESMTKDESSQRGSKGNAKTMIR
jgi:hypothetical protein